MCPGIRPGLKRTLGSPSLSGVGAYPLARVVRFAPACGPWASVPIGIDLPSMVKVYHRCRDLSSTFSKNFLFLFDKP